MGVNPVTFRGKGQDGTPRNLSVGRLWLGSEAGGWTQRTVTFVFWQGDDSDSVTTVTVLSEDDYVIPILSALIHDGTSGSIPSSREGESKFVTVAHDEDAAYVYALDGLDGGWPRKVLAQAVIPWDHFQEGLSLLFPHNELETTP